MTPPCSLGWIDSPVQYLFLDIRRWIANGFGWQGADPKKDQFWRTVFRKLPEKTSPLNPFSMFWQKSQRRHPFSVLREPIKDTIVWHSSLRF